MIRTISLIPVALILAACSTATPSPYSEADFDDAQTKASLVSEALITDSGDVPTSGEATYTGQLSGEVNGDIYGAILGDLSLTADFQSGNVTGTVSRIGFKDWDGDEDQLLDGDLDFDGSIAASTLAGTASGRLGAVDENGFRGSSNVVLGLDGEFRTVTTAADTFYGTVTGTGSGDFDVTMSSGEFYAEK